MRAENRIEAEAITATITITAMTNHVQGIGLFATSLLGVTWRIAAPHAEQNFALSGTSLPHL